MGRGWDGEKRGWGYYSPCCSRHMHGLWHMHGHPGLQGPGKGALSLHLLLTDGKVKGACQGLYQTSEAGRSPGRNGGACV